MKQARRIINNKQYLSNAQEERRNEGSRVRVRVRSKRAREHVKKETSEVEERERACRCSVYP